MHYVLHEAPNQGYTLLPLHDNIWQDKAA